MGTALGTRENTGSGGASWITREGRGNDADQVVVILISNRLGTKKSRRECWRGTKRARRVGEGGQGSVVFVREVWQ